MLYFFTNIDDAEEQAKKKLPKMVNWVIYRVIGFIRFMIDTLIP